MIVAVIPTVVSELSLCVRCKCSAFGLLMSRGTRFNNFRRVHGVFGSCRAALEVLLVDMEAQTKAKLNKKAHSAVILCLGNKILREVTAETTATGVWSKLETLYMTKSLANKLYLKKKLYTFYMLAGRKISAHIDEFNKICYMKGEELILGSRQSGESQESKDSRWKTSVYTCQSEDHMKRNCPKNNRKKLIGYVKKDEQRSSSGSTYDDSDADDADERTCLLDWIMDSGCSYHMTPRDNCVYYLDVHAMAGELNASDEEKDSLAHVWHKRLDKSDEGGTTCSGIRGYGFISSGSNTKHLESLKSGSIESYAMESRICYTFDSYGTPQQNELAELMNRTLMDMVRYLLIQSGLPKTFWAEVTCTLQYTFKKSPPTAIDKKTLKFSKH
ncbi:retrovirus-related pol polyprotein from transposon TNT 1-94 [Tanacetum coccineum]